MFRHLNLVAITCASIVVSFETASATVVSVGASTTGGFGSPNNGWVPMTNAQTFLSGEAVSIQASGTINLAAPDFQLITTPDGITLTVGPPHIGTSDFFPLEEYAVDSGSLVLPRALGTSVFNIGALMGAFVPLDRALNPAFQAADQDLVALGIQSNELFLVGSGPFRFTAPFAGVLFLGINDAYNANNVGSFSANITEVPAPAVLSIFLAAGFMRVRRR